METAELKAVLILVIERLMALEEHQQRDATLLFQLNTTLQGHPLGALIAQSRDNSSQIVAKRLDPDSSRKLADIVRQLKEV